MIGLIALAALGSAVLFFLLVAWRIRDTRGDPGLGFKGWVTWLGVAFLAAIAAQTCGRIFR